jgi:putative DNA primase/helicase
MDTLCRQSGLMREKGDRSLSGSTYGAVTLEKAVASCAEFYKPIAGHSASEDFNDVLQDLKTLHPEKSDRYRRAQSPGEGHAPAVAKRPF